MLKSLSLGSPIVYFSQISADQLPDPASWQTSGWLLAGILILMGMANTGLDLWNKLFPKKVPPDHERYATKEELLRELARIESEFEAQMSRLEDETDEDMCRVERAIKEGLDEVKALVRAEIQQERSWQKSLDEWKLVMERAMGHVEEKAKLALDKAGARRS